MPRCGDSVVAGFAGGVMTDIKPPCRLSLFGGCLIAGS